MPLKALFVIGTRPEGIKLAPVVSILRDDPRFEIRVCITAQHREMLDDVLKVFSIVPDYDLAVMRPGQDLYHVTSAVLLGMKEVIARWRPDWVLVQGDTTTTFAAALAAAYERVSIGHVEAGLRTGNRDNPFPEEVNRMMTACIADLHFAPSEAAAENLRREARPEADIVVTGNTVLDALYRTIERCHERQYTDLGLDERDLMLVTIHRRENFGTGVRAICRALARFAEDHPDWQIVWPVHPNPQIKEVVDEVLSARTNIRLVDPLRYDAFVHAMARAKLILTDSGGVLEEASSLGKFVLVARRFTERMEAVRDGAARLLMPNEHAVLAGLEDALVSRSWEKARRGNWYGDGHAAECIRDALLNRSRSRT